MVKTEFLKNKDEQDEEKIIEHKNAAMRALTNYLIHVSSKTDERIAENINRKTDDN
jgi:hypothetical protein